MNFKKGVKTEPERERNAYDDVKFLTGTYGRFRLLSVLQGAAQTRSELAENLNVHRTTIRRNLRELAERGWITNEAGNVYAITPAGEIVLSSFDDLLGDVEFAAKLGSFHSKLDGELPDDADALATGEIVCNGFDEPFAAVHEFTEFVETADQLRVAIPAINPKYAPLLAAESESTDIEIVGPRECFETLREREATEFETLRRAETVRVLVIDERPSFGLCIDRERCLIVAYNDGIGIHGVLRFDDPPASIDRWVADEYASVTRTESRLE